MGFVDPDDWVDADMYERMLATLTAAQADICMCNYVKETKEGTVPILMKQSEIIEKESILGDIVANVIAKSSFRSGETDIMGSGSADFWSAANCSKGRTSGSTRM